MADFASILKSLRTSKAISQPELATRLGISKSAISMYEQGRREPDFDILRKIADFFQVDIDYLLGHSPKPADHFSPTTIAAHLDTSDLTQAELDDVADYIEFIRSKRKS
ncbi:MAG: helix-turn-helix domain-containing protein [Dorea sp.]|nr:helix-turn-helix domain-containing protein [Dorea sp.]MDY2814262.1 helix-turn-helix transcriptional regulator [Dorea sp.]